jgi:hypothetical protein
MTSEPLDDFLLGKVAGALERHGYRFPSEMIRAALEGKPSWQNRQGRWLEITQVTRDICTYAAKEAGLL